MNQSLSFPLLMTILIVPHAMKVLRREEKVHPVYSTPSVIVNPNKLDEDGKSIVLPEGTNSSVVSSISHNRRYDYRRRDSAFPISKTTIPFLHVASMNVDDESSESFDTFDDEDVFGPEADDELPDDVNQEGFQQEPGVDE